MLSHSEFTEAVAKALLMQISIGTQDNHRTRLMNICYIILYHHYTARILNCALLLMQADYAVFVVGGVDLLVTLQKARIAPRTCVALRLNRYLDRTAVLL